MQIHLNFENDQAIDENRSGTAAGSTLDLLLVCEARSTNIEDGRWRFVLEASNGEKLVEAADEEAGDLNRLTLLAAVRGLEAIEGPACVTLVSSNRYLIRSLTDALPRWRGNDYVWEHFGRRIEIQNSDLWRRVDRALKIHRVEACLMTSRLISAGSIAETTCNANSDSKTTLRIDSAHATFSGNHFANPNGSPDQLRSWLLSGGASIGSRSGRRFTVADLMEAS
jgi:ribonuclease HI